MPLALLALKVFIIGTSEFVIVGLCPTVLRISIFDCPAPRLLTDRLDRRAASVIPSQARYADKELFNTARLELIDSRALVRDKVWELLFVLGQPLYVGSTQVNINPVAIH